MFNIAQLLLVLICYLPFSSFADEDRPKGTIINLSEQSSLEVENDLLVTELKFSAKDIDSVKLQDKINSVINEAFKIVENYKEVEVSTQRYSVYQRYEANSEKKIEEWQGEQSIIITSQNKDQLLELTGKLQQLGMTINSLQYQLSKGKNEATYNSLLEPTINKLKEKAKKIAKSLDKEDFEFLSMNLDSQVIIPNDVMMYKTSASESGAYSRPVAVKGKTNVTVNVNAQILIKE